MKNVISDPEYAALKAKLKTQVLEFQSK